MEFTDNLDNYLNLKDTSSCYLDGRYFNKVFERYPGLISEPLNITIRVNKKNEENSKYFTFIRCRYYAYYFFRRIRIRKTCRNTLAKKRYKKTDGRNRRTF